MKLLISGCAECPYLKKDRYDYCLKKFNDASEAYNAGQCAEYTSEYSSLYKSCPFCSTCGSLLKNDGIGNMYCDDCEDVDVIGLSTLPDTDLLKALDKFHKKEKNELTAKHKEEVEKVIKLKTFIFEYYAVRVNSKDDEVNRFIESNVKKVLELNRDVIEEYTYITLLYVEKTKK